ncbi:hypothetical protein VII00023_08039 [Vibrio ichthyoenteri ATCC 700023]|uniref:Uncharacterized protein n=1 Tax=Vibrio ichthyoenteri ATCC 700023 TaxID=870968 RepID=F9RZW9_9VIBR|nr:hypothetical protein [Vibrio ichthyoenteri]EGU44192.1 hypothetical protein VII00023_08039 [Vibrio ichthyoenteri ATCC 700023]
MKLNHIYHQYRANNSNLLKASSISAFKIGDIPLAEKIISVKITDAKLKLIELDRTGFNSDNYKRYANLEDRINRLSLGVKGLISMPILEDKNTRLFLGEKGMMNAPMLQDKLSINEMLKNRYALDSVLYVKTQVQPSANEIVSTALNKIVHGPDSPLKSPLPEEVIQHFASYGIRLVEHNVPLNMAQETISKFIDWIQLGNRGAAKSGLAAQIDSAIDRKYITSELLPLLTSEIENQLNIYLLDFSNKFDLRSSDGQRLSQSSIQQWVADQNSIMDTWL